MLPIRHLTLFPFFTVLALTVLLTALAGCDRLADFGPTRAAETPVPPPSPPPPFDLAANMAAQLRWTEELGRSAGSGDWGKAALSLAELRATSLAVISPARYHDEMPLGPLTRAMILPALDDLALAVVAQDPILFDPRFTTLVAACHACHEATDQPAVPALTTASLAALPPL